MSDPSIFLAAGLVFAAIVAAVALAFWRMRVHAASRAAAEARMTAAMDELNRLAARLEEQRAELAQLDARLVDSPPKPDES
jgi:hypothetical protein